MGKSGNFLLRVKPLLPDKKSSVVSLTWPKTAQVVKLHSSPVYPLALVSTLLKMNALAPSPNVYRFQAGIEVRIRRIASVI